MAQAFGTRKDGQAYPKITVEILDPMQDPSFRRYLRYVELIKESETQLHLDQVLDHVAQDTVLTGKQRELLYEQISKQRSLVI